MGGPSRCPWRAPARGQALALASLVAAAVGLAGPARGDGGLIITEEESHTEVGSQEEAAAGGLVSSSGQRAVIWLSDDRCWDLYIDPGTIDVDGAAWILPLPAVPEVDAASSAFLDQLDAATVPVLVTQEQTVVTTYRSVSDGGSGLGCAGAMASDGRGDGEELDSTVEDDGSADEARDVTVWGEGRLGALEYDIVSSEDPEALELWLEDNGYVVPETMLGAVAAYVDEGYVFFAGQVAREPAIAARRIPVVRFTLCGPDPWYPIRLSAVSIAEALEFTLFVVLSEGRSALAPESCSYRAVSDVLWDLEYDDWYGEEVPDFQHYYDEQVGSILSEDGGRSLALEMAAPLTLARAERRVSALGGAAAEVGLDRPAVEWSPELQAIVEGELQVMRWTGRFPPAAMDVDLFFEARPVPSEDGVHTRTITHHEERWVHDSGEEEEEAEPVFDSLECAVSGGEPRARRRPGSGAVTLLVGLALALVSMRWLRRG